MNQAVIWVYGVTMCLLLATAVYAERITMKLSVGERIYICDYPGCCPCDTLSRSRGNCSCGVELLPATVGRVSEGKVYFEQSSRAYSIIGKYACPVSCKSATVSQHPGTCNCGRKMEMVS